MAEDNSKDKDSTNAGTGLVKNPDFRDMYANNVRFESSTWDLRLIFGVLDQPPGDGGESIRQHTGMNLSWPQAKVAAYYLYVNILINDVINGRVSVSDAVKPEPFGPPPDGWKDDPNAVKAIERINALWETLFTGK